MYKRHFSHIYLETEAARFPDARSLIKKFSNAVVIEIDDYKRVFNRTRQNFQAQKNSMKLILATKKDRLLYPGSDMSPSFGHAQFYYNTMVLNCIYNCDYCYLQGMYDSANLVVFVNSDDFFSAVESKLQDHPVYLCISYDTDLLAFENVHPLCARWINFASTRPDLTVEIRTKSSNYKAIGHLHAVSNVILAWTLSPQAVTQTYEVQTPPLEQRLRSVESAIADGWRVRLCFDPVLAVKNWSNVYGDFLESLRLRVSWDKVYDVSVGTFRMNGGYLSKIKSARMDSDILYDTMKLEDGTASYPAPVHEEIMAWMTDKLRPLVGSERLHI